MTSKRMLCASAIPLVLAFMLAIPASAQRDDDRDRDRGERNCKGDRISASGNAVWRPFSRQKELDGKGAAFANAVANWQREVRTKYGELWMQYERARGKDGGRVGRPDFDCQQASVGTFGKNIIRCTISGDPCARRAETTEAPDPGRGDPTRTCQFDIGDVRQAQRLMNSCDGVRDCDTEADGILGPQTARCLKKFQQRAGLRVTGEPCESTLREMQRRCGGGRYRDR
jgi:peptidoglycan hydrolase-like protein with peptidoglycan-binding domain